MLKINNKLDTRTIEQAYKHLNDGSLPDLLITNKFSNEFGIVPALIQLVSTWYMLVSQGKIIIDVKEGAKLDEFYSMDYFFPIITYCWSRDIQDNSGNDLKSLLREYNIVAHERMRKQELGGGFKIMLSCFDHLSKRKGLLNAFYIDGEFIDNELMFGSAIDKALKQVLSFNKNLTRALASIYPDLIDIIYELVKNTDNWATTDYNNKPLNPSTRGLFLKFHKKKQSTLAAEFSDQEGIRNYFTTSNFEKNSLDEAYFLELSVYDTGIGFVNRYKPNPGSEVYSTKEQVDIVKECLLRNNTSAVGLSKKVKGKGLDRIMNILDNRGFIWIRTGGVSVYRNLRQDRYRKDSLKHEIQLLDWFNKPGSEYSNLEYVQGSVISLVYPISTLLNG